LIVGESKCDVGFESLGRTDRDDGVWLIGEGSTTVGRNLDRVGDNDARSVNDDDMAV
jgi:hypothetical protein